MLVLGAAGAGGAGEASGEWERPMVLDRAADGEDGRDKQTGKIASRIRACRIWGLC